MMKTVLFVLGMILVAKICMAQQVVIPCVYTTTAGVTTCVPISTSHPLPAKSN